MGDPLDGTSFDAFTTQVVAEYDLLPPQLQRIAQFVLDNPQRVALMTIADLAEEIDVQPSGVIRFSKALGYSGFSEIQRILKGQLGDLIPNTYYDRLQAAAPSEESEIARARSLAEVSLTALPSQDDIAAAAQALVEARLVHVIGLRRAFGMASYLTYLLAGFEAPVRQVTGVAGMTDVEALSITAKDALVAISFPNYIAETRSVVSAARVAGAMVVVITDSHLSPVARQARHVLLTDQQTEAGFRSGVGTMVTAQALAMEYGRRRRS